MKRISLLLLLSTLALLLAAASANGSGSGSIVVKEIYASGGNSGAVYTNDYVELFNRGTGSVAIVLEGVPMQLAAEITQKLSIPTIGIGAGPHCDGQVLVVNDVLGLSDRTPPKFVKRYANVREQVLAAAGEFKREVEEGTFPDDSHSYH